MKTQKIANKFLIWSFSISICLLSLGVAKPVEWTTKEPTNWISHGSKVWENDSKTCMVYDRYFIVGMPRKEEVGTDYFVFKRGKNEPFPESCGTSTTKAWDKYIDGQYGDADIVDDYLFLDSGTGGVRGLQIVSLIDKKDIATANYNGMGTMSVGNGKLNYQGLLFLTDEEKRGAKISKKCVWSAKQPKEVFQENYHGKLQIDLKTGRSTISDARCDVGPVAD